MGDHRLGRWGVIAPSTPAIVHNDHFNTTEIAAEGPNDRNRDGFTVPESGNRVQRGLGAGDRARFATLARTGI